GEVVDERIVEERPGQGDRQEERRRRQGGENRKPPPPLTFEAPGRGAGAGDQEKRHGVERPRQAAQERGHGQDPAAEEEVDRQPEPGADRQSRRPPQAGSGRCEEKAPKDAGAEGEERRRERRHFTNRFFIRWIPRSVTGTVAVAR